MIDYPCLFLCNIWWTLRDVTAVAPRVLTCGCLLQSLILSRDLHTTVCKLNWYQVLKTNLNVTDFSSRSTFIRHTACTVHEYLNLQVTRSLTNTTGLIQILSTLYTRWPWKHKHCAFSGKRRDSFTVSALLKLLRNTHRHTWNVS